MKITIRTILTISILIIAAGAYLFIPSGDASTELEINFCIEPLTYRIGQFDTQFGLTEAEMIQALEKAADLWNQASGQTLVEFDSEGDIPVNLIYDDRQKLVDNERRAREQVRSEEIRIQALENEYRRDSLTYSQRLNRYETQSEEIQNKINSLNQWVVEKNGSGGLNEAEAEEFERKKNEIDELNNQITQEGLELSTLADQLNQKTSQLNDRIDDKNQLVEEYNNTYSGERQFTQGTYQYHGSSRSISIHQFMSMDDLVLVLTHEIGHALGIDHGSNPQSIMYPETRNQSRSPIQLTDEDRRAVREICN